MHRIRTDRIEEIFVEACELPDGQRAAFLERVCGGDRPLRAEVESLLSADSSAGDFLQGPAYRQRSEADAEAIAQLVGRSIGGYRIERVIATGGMGAVYEATQEHPGRCVALKVVRAGLTCDEFQDRLFRREMQALARLNHPCIATIYDAGLTPEGMRYFAMELVAGVPLDEYVRGRRLDGETGPLEPRQRWRLFHRICQAIGYAHQRGVIHRDLKPANVLVTADGTPKILDFGLARAVADDPTISVVSEAGRLLGTPAYMSPEQTRGDPQAVDVRSDVYTLGVMLYELTTGTLPYDVRQAAMVDTVKIITSAPPRAPRAINRHVPVDIETIILKALEKEPERRYQSVSELADDVERFLDNHPIHARPPSALYRWRMFARRNRALVTALAAVSFTLIAATGVSTWFAIQANRQREAQERQRLAAERVTEFLESMLTANEPGTALGREVPVSEVLDQASRRVETELGDQPLVAAEIHDTIGRTYMSLARYDEAEQHYRRAVELFTQELGEDDPRTALASAHLAWLLVQRAEPTTAIELFDPAIERLRRAQPGDNEDLAWALNGLAGAYDTAGDDDAALPLVQEALEMRRRLFGEQSRWVAQSLSLLARIRENDGDFPKAIEIRREVLEITRGIFGDQHPATATAMTELANPIRLQGDSAQAIDLHTQALAIYRKVLPATHPQLAAALSSLGFLLAYDDKPKQAEPPLLEALEIKKKLFGEDNPALTQEYVTLGMIYRKTNRPADAERVYAKAIENIHAHDAPRDTDMAKCLQGLAILQKQQGQYEPAEANYREALAVWEELDGHDHYNVASLYNDLGALYRASDHLDAAEESYAEALAILRRVLTPNHPKLAAGLSRLAQVMEDKGEYERAEPLLREALEVRHAADPPGPASVAFAKSTLALCLAHLGKYDESGRLAREGYEEMLKAAGKGSRFTVQTAKWAVEVFELSGDEDAAAEFRALLPE